MKFALSFLATLLGMVSPALATVTVTSPANGAKVTSPVQYVASATSPTCAKGVSAMGIYVNNQRVFVQNGTSLNTAITLANGTYSTVVQEWDGCGGSTTTPINITVGSAPTGTTTAVVVSSPTNNSTVTSPVTFAATSSTAACSSGIAAIGVYVDNVLLYKTNGTVLNTSQPVSAGKHQATLQAWDNCGGAIKTPVTFTAQASQAPTVMLTASPASITSGSASTLTISATNATKVVLTGSNGTSYNLAATGGSQSVTPTATTTYTATATGASNSVTATTTVTVTTGTTAVVVSSPTNNSTVTSPVTFAATSSTAACASGIAATGVYVDNVLLYKTNGTVLNTSQPVSAGKHQATLQAWDNCGGAIKTPVTFTVQASQSATVTLSASPNSVMAGGTSVLTAVASNATKVEVTGSDGSAFALAATGGTQSVTPTATTTYTATATGASGTTTATATVTVGSGANVSTWQADTNRSGLNASETTLSPANVNTKTFGKLFSYSTDGYAYGEPLLMSNINVNGAVHNVVYVATEHDTVYAFDADSYGTGAPLWQTSLLKSGESPLTNGPIQPFEGVTSTPVIDPATNTIYVISSQIASGGTGTFRLSALDITTGAQKPGSPVTIQASVPGTNSASVNGITSLTTSCVQRAALLLANGSVYAGFGGCHSGWLLAYDATKLTQTGVFNASPNLNGEGAYASAGGIWMGGGGPVADSAGNVYAVTGNGPWDGKTSFADSVLKFNPTLGMLSYFTPQDYAYMNCNDADLAAGGLLLIPGTTEALAGGKTGRLYLVNTNNLGGEQTGDAGVTQTLFFEADKSNPYSQTCTDSSGTHTTSINSYEIFGTGAFFNGSVYLGISPTGSNVDSGIRQFTYSNGVLTPSTQATQNIQAGSYGTTPFISANGKTNGVLWMIDHGNPLQSSTPSAATLRAYDVTNLSTELYDSAMTTGDAPGYGIKFTSPIVANGKVYMSSGHDLSTTANPKGELDIFGLK